MNTENTSMQEVVDLTRAKILHQLEIFPFLSRSMIHVSVGTATPTQLWVPILDALIEEGLVTTTELSCKTPVDRNQVYTVYHLATHEYTYGPHNATTHSHANANVSSSGVGGGLSTKAANA